MVEIDGKIHKHQAERDKYRTAIINQKGIFVVRFKNEEIVNNISAVMKKLVHYL